jgi:hypothetical protein
LDLPLMCASRRRKYCKIQNIHYGCYLIPELSVTLAECSAEGYCIVK